MKTESSLPRISVVILNWNGRDDTIRCLSSLVGLTYRNHEVIVVDNGSNDDSVAAVRASFPSVHIIETGKNLGYAGGNNVGIRWALACGAEYILILNNDTVVDPGLLGALVRASTTLPAPSIIGAAIYFMDQPEQLWYRGGRWDSDACSFRHEGYGQPLNPDIAVIREVDYVTGCALFAPRQVFETIGGFNEDYFLTYEETDFCYRAREAGYLCVVTTEARLWHAVSASFGGADAPLMRYFMARNGLLWARRHLQHADYRRVRNRTWVQLRMNLLPTFVYFKSGASRIKEAWWSMNSWWRRVQRSWRDPGNLAEAVGVIHHHVRRYGNCPTFVRRLNARR